MCFIFIVLDIDDILYTYLRIKPLSQNGTNTSPSSNKKPDPESLTVDESKKNPCFPAVHSVVKFHYQSHRGRYAVADEDIEVCNVNCYFSFLYLYRTRWQYQYNIIWSFWIRLELHCFENLQLHTLFILKNTEQTANTASHRFAPSFHVQNAFGCVFVVLNVETKPYPRIIGISTFKMSCYNFSNKKVMKSTLIVPAPTLIYFQIWMLN